MALPDQDSFYDVTDKLELLGMEAVIRKHMNNKGTEPDLRTQFTIYEVTTRNGFKYIYIFEEHVLPPNRRLFQ